MPTELSDVWSVLDRGGTVGALLLFIVGSVRRWWVFAHHYEEMQARLIKMEARIAKLEEDRDEWIDTAQALRTTSKKATRVAQLAVSQ